jgi:purine nucleoside phosphorylase
MAPAGLNKFETLKAGAVMSVPFSCYRESAEYIREKIGGFSPQVAMVLGSGLGWLGDIVEEPVSIPYGEIPHFKASTAPGHKGRWYSACCVPGGSP